MKRNEIFITKQGGEVKWKNGLGMD
jgi:hypothetical protein